MEGVTGTDLGRFGKSVGSRECYRAFDSISTTLRVSTPCSVVRRRSTFPMQVCPGYGNPPATRSTGRHRA